jgi:hypothetical protein
MAYGVMLGYACQGNHARTETREVKRFAYL